MDERNSGYSGRERCGRRTEDGYRGMGTGNQKLRNRYIERGWGNEDAKNSFPVEFQQAFWTSTA
jgi:hypothetical protein